jgi:hypothetical protein
MRDGAAYAVFGALIVALLLCRAVRAESELVAAQARQMALWEARQSLMNAGRGFFDYPEKIPDWIYAETRSGIAVSRTEWCRIHREKWANSYRCAKKSGAEAPQ